MNAVDNYVRKRRWKKARIREKFPLLIAITEILMKDVINAVERNTCPYCNAEMGSKASTIHHILLNHVDLYYGDIKHVVDAYVRLRQRMTRINKYVGGTSTQVYRLNIGGKVIIGKQREIAGEILRNPVILRELGLI
jgi:hypothetical protein